VQEEVSGRNYYIFVGISSEAAAGQRLLPEVHQVEQQGEGHLQAGGQQGRVPAVGAAQEQARHEL